MSLNIPPSKGLGGREKFFLCCFADLVKRRGQGNMRLIVQGKTLSSKQECM